METRKISIHKALSELKTIDNRIQKAINSLTPVGLYRFEEKVNGITELKEFNEDAKTNYQSLNDLIKRKITLKRAIVKINASTKVSVSGQEMTIAEAINMKETIFFKKQLYNALEKVYQKAKADMQIKNEEVEVRALEVAKEALRKDRVRIGDKDVSTIIKPYMDMHLYSLADPLKIVNELSKLKEEIDNFEIEIDSALSEINAITLIEI
jgi:hypothetical protein